VKASLSNDGGELSVMISDPAINSVESKRDATPSTTKTPNEVDNQEKQKMQSG